MVTVPSLLAVVRIVLLTAGLTVLAAPAFPQQANSRQEALAQLAAADSTGRMEAIVWFANHGTMADAGLLEQRLRDEDDTVRAYAARGVEEMEQGDNPAAIATFSQVVKKKPGFAEGWNKRATAYYIVGDYERSIADCAQVLKRNPHHFGALSGLGQIYYRMDDYEKSIEWFRKALEVNPNMAGVELNLKALEAMQRERKGKRI